jgi:DNA/RNA endonuclease G (NUC1)
MNWTTPPNINTKKSKSTMKSKSTKKYSISVSSNKTSISLDNILNYTKLLHGNKYNQRTINESNLLFLKKQEFDIFYSTKYKYPLLVAETITARTGLTDPNHPQIDRRLIEDPFRQDTVIAFNQQHTLEDYKAYMEYGGSMGHNAPAGQHKTNINVYNETFLLTNITPQEMVFNSGLWVLLEQWCRNLGRNSRLEKVMVMTGSIPARFNSDFNGINMNVPSKMFKIVCIRFPKQPNVCHMEIFNCDNKPYIINYSLSTYDLSKYLISHAQYGQFQKESGVNIKKLLEYYGFTSSRIKPFNSHLNISIYLNPVVKLLMKKSEWFGRLIYARNLDILEHEWVECQKLATEFENLQFHQEFYNFAKRRLMRGSRLSRTTYTNYSWKTPHHSITKKTRQSKKHIANK